MHACVTEGQLDCVSKLFGKEYLFSNTLSTFPCGSFPISSYVQRKCRIVRLDLLSKFLFY